MSGGSAAGHKALSQLAAQLTALKEAADWEAARRALPPLAASLAYSNYAAWREGGGGELGDVAPGVTLEDVYRAGEREELRLQKMGGQLRPQGGSTLDDFVRRGPGAAYAGLAAGAMERVRARLMGYEDDRTAGPAAADAEEGAAAGSSEQAKPAKAGAAARRVVRALLQECGCREERAEALAEACVPPGLLVTVADDSGSGAPSGSSISSGSGAARRVRLCTTPPQLLAAIGEERREVPDPTPQLPSGEAVSAALDALAEDVDAYNTAVWSRLSPLERYGAGPGPRW